MQGLPPRQSLIYVKPIMLKLVHQYDNRLGLIDYHVIHMKYRSRAKDMQRKTYLFHHSQIYFRIIRYAFVYSMQSRVNTAILDMMSAVFQRFLCPHCARILHARHVDYLMFSIYFCFSCGQIFVALPQINNWAVDNKYWPLRNPRIGE